MLYPTELRARTIHLQALAVTLQRRLTPNYILVYYTSRSRMKAENDKTEDGDHERTWQPTQYANIVRHVPSGIYYARLRIKGKLISAHLGASDYPLSLW